MLNVLDCFAIEVHKLPINAWNRVEMTFTNSLDIPVPVEYMRLVATHESTDQPHESVSIDLFCCALDDVDLGGDEDEDDYAHRKFFIPANSSDFSVLMRFRCHRLAHLVIRGYEILSLHSHSRIMFNELTAKANTSSRCSSSSSSKIAANIDTQYDVEMIADVPLVDDIRLRPVGDCDTAAVGLRAESKSLNIECNLGVWYTKCFASFLIRKIHFFHLNLPPHELKPTVRH